jgi:hypothetical protein
MRRSDERQIEDPGRRLSAVLSDVLGAVQQAALYNVEVVEFTRPH